MYAGQERKCPVCGATNSADMLVNFNKCVACNSDLSNSKSQRSVQQPISKNKKV